MADTRNGSASSLLFESQPVANAAPQSNRCVIGAVKRENVRFALLRGEGEKLKTDTAEKRRRKKEMKTKDDCLAYV